MPFQILCLSGGGYLGLYTIAVLSALEDRFGSPLAKHFDLIAGTSVGGIVALGLAAEKPAKEIQNAFEENGKRIFSDRARPQSQIAALYDLHRYAIKPKYDGIALRETITKIVGEGHKIGHLQHPVLIPSINMTKGRPQVFKTPHHKSFPRDLKLSTVDVAMATSAAPTFFPLAAIGDELFADGGLYANSPDLMALHEAEVFFGKNLSDVRVLSIGTTTSQFSLSHVTGPNLGSIHWMKEQRLIQATISSQQLAVDYMVGHKLEDRYFRIDEIQSREHERDLGLDTATDDASKTIRAIAAGSVQRIISDPWIAKTMEHEAPPPTFYWKLSDEKGTG